MHIIRSNLVVTLFWFRGKWNEESKLVMSVANRLNNQDFVAYLNEAYSQNETNAEVVSVRPFHGKDDEGEE